MLHCKILSAAGLFLAFVFSGRAQSPADYFQDQTRQIEASSAAAMSSAKVWKEIRPELREEAADMLGLHPMPPRTDLKAVVTGALVEEDFVVEKVAFQSIPRLYVTANLYIPKNLNRPAPAILYLCGHTTVITNGINCGNKAAYQQHGISLARNGYVCLILDTLELGEAQGHHKGTFDLGMWWWNARGYTPAGVETWNAIRALDYLFTRPEVDTNRIGVTGRSGGGAYCWFLAALDDRVKVIAPVAGIADLQSYAVEGTVDSHCDCMFFVNTYRWDYPLLAALCAPRPLLLENTDADALFPLDGVLRTEAAVKRVYQFYDAQTNFGLVIAPGPHHDSPDLQVPVLRWFNIHLKHQDPTIDTAVSKSIPPLRLRVLGRVPSNERNIEIERSFVPPAPEPIVPRDAAEWKDLKSLWMDGLRHRCFAGWPLDAGPLDVKLTYVDYKDTNDCMIEQFQSQGGVPLQLWIIRNPAADPRRVFLQLADFHTKTSVGIKPLFDALIPDWRQQVASNTEVAIFIPRGTNTTGLRRRYMLIGQTLDGMRVWDIRRAIQALQASPLPVWIRATGDLAVDALYASLFENNVAGLDLRDVPSNHYDGPDYLNVLRVLDLPQAAAMAADRCSLRLQPARPEGWEYLRAMAAFPAAHLRVTWEK